MLTSSWVRSTIVNIILTQIVRDFPKGTEQNKIVNNSSNYNNQGCYWSPLKETKILVLSRLDWRIVHTRRQKYRLYPKYPIPRLTVFFFYAIWNFYANTEDVTQFFRLAYLTLKIILVGYPRMWCLPWNVTKILASSSTMFNLLFLLRIAHCILSKLWKNILLLHKLARISLP